jgi:predicted nucleic acid-binding protein
MILDTGFLIDLIQGEKAAQKKAEKLEQQDRSLKISSATLFELYTGIEKSSKPEEEKEKVKQVLESKTVIDIDKKISKKAGKLNGRLLNDGETIQSFDTLIAATALIHEEKILTPDEDFQKIENLETENY